MSRQVKIEIIYGFNSYQEFTQDEIESLEKNGVTASPLCGTTEDKPYGYILGKLLNKMSHVGMPKSIEFLTPTQLAGIKANVLQGIDNSGYDITNKDFSVIMNAYFY